MKQRLWKIVLLCAVMMCLFAIPAAADTVGGGIVTADYLNLRTGPGTDYVSRALIPENSFLPVMGQNGNWYEVIYRGERGFVSGDYLNFTETLDGSYAGKVLVNGDDVYLRSGPGQTNAVLGIYDRGVSFNVLGVSKEWLKVANDDGKLGYIRSDLLEFVAEETAPTAADGAALVESAKKYLGVRYLWGGMSENGFDCSGFINYIYQLYDIPLYRVAQDIYTYNGTSVSKDALQVGDLVFFGYSARNITHVGMYIGDGEFIHASSGAGKVVITELSKDYYKRMYIGAKRILE